VVGTWGNKIASQEDLPAFVQSLASLSNVLVQLSLPAGESLEAVPQKARLVTLASNTAPIEAQFLGPAAAVDPQTQARAFLFIVISNSPGLAPGAAVEGRMVIPGPPLSGLSLPRDAIIRFGGTTWVYRQLSPESFERTAIHLEQPLAEGWFVSKDLKPQDKVVTGGAQLLLSEELKGAIGNPE
jgi:multidrug efflux pump subunit AcrA (membrane-fusion protein)